MKDLITKLKAVKGLPLIIIALTAGIILIVVGNIGENKTPTTSEQTEAVGETEDYTAELEARIAVLVRNITGRDCVVLLTVERGEELVFARDGGENGSYVKDDPLLLCSNSPVISGAAVVAGASESARLEIINLLSALLGLPANRIYVR